MDGKFFFINYTLDNYRFLGVRRVALTVWGMFCVLLFLDAIEDVILYIWPNKPATPTMLAYEKVQEY